MSRPQPVFLALGDPGFPAVGTPFRWRLERQTAQTWIPVGEWHPHTETRVSRPTGPGPYRIYAETAQWAGVLAMLD